MAELPDILEFSHRTISGRGGTLQGLPEADRRKFVGWVDYRLSEMSASDRRAFEHQVWHATVGRYGTPEHRELGPAAGCVRATATYVYMLVEEALRHRDAAPDKPAAPKKADFRPILTKQARDAISVLRLAGKHEEAEALAARYAPDFQ